MSYDRLPEGVISMGSSPTFTKDTLPKAFCSEHALPPKRWGVLQILEGAVTYIDLPEGQEREVSAPDLVVIGPQCPHKLRLHEGNLRCQVDFFKEVEEEAPLVPGVEEIHATGQLPDLDRPEQIEILVRKFYGRVQKDDLLAPVFVNQANVDWEEHIHMLTAFWCQLELGIPGFQGSPTRKHSALSSVTPFRKEQFARWVALFHDTVDRGWSGPHAYSIKERATRIATIQSSVVQGAETWSGEWSGA